MKKLLQILVLGSLVLQPVSLAALDDEFVQEYDIAPVAILASVLYEQVFLFNQIGNDPEDQWIKQMFAGPDFVFEIKQIFQNESNDPEVNLLKNSMQNSFTLSEFSDLIDASFDYSVDTRVTLLELFTLYCSDAHVVQLLLELGYNVDNQARYIVSQIMKSLKRANITNQERENLQQCKKLIMNAASSTVLFCCIG